MDSAPIDGRVLVRLLEALGQPVCLRLCWPTGRPMQATGDVMNMNLRTVRRRCEQLAHQIGVPAPFDLDTFVARVATMRGRRIETAAMSTGSVSPCGLWVATVSVDLIFFEEGTSPVHQRHIVVHELGHLCFDHQGITGAGPDVAGLPPQLNPASIRRTLARTTVTDVEETEAEMFATVVLDATWQRPSWAAGVAGPAGVADRQRLDRLADALEPAPPDSRDATRW